MVAQLLQTVDPAPPVVRWSARIAATAVAALALADCGGHECGPPSAIGPCGSPPQHETALGVAVADFNGDGQPDVAIPLSYGGNPPGAVGIYQHLSMSGNRYAARVDYPVGGTPYTILVLDLNGDGAPDVLTSDYRLADVAVLLNSSTDPGTFGAAQILPAIDVSHVAVADMNGDGFRDLVIAARPLLLSLQDIGAPGTFTPPTTLYTNPNGKNFRSSALSDLNGDGTPDIAVADDDGVSVLFATSSTGTPTIASTMTIYTNARSGEFPAIALADVNGDGRDDLVIADPGGRSVAVLQQSGAVAGQFLPAAMFGLPAGTGLSVVVADLNGDSYADIVSGGSAVVAVLLQDAARPGAFLAAIPYGAPIGANAVAVADIDSDGLPDIVTNSGVTSTVDSGIRRTPPGVLYQDPSRPGFFLALQDLGVPTCVQPPPGLVGWWPGDGTTDDIIGGRNAELQAGASMGPGFVKEAFLLRGDGDFDGIGDFVSVPDDPALNFGISDFTIDLWASFSDPGTGEQVLVEKYVQRADLSLSEGWTFTKLAGNELLFLMVRNGLGQGSTSGPLSIPVETWIHFAATRQAGVISLFVNGRRVSSDSFAEGNIDADTSSSIKFGHRGNPSDTPGSEDDRGFFLSGGIDEVEIFIGRALSADEVLAIYGADRAGKCKLPSSSSR